MASPAPSTSSATNNPPTKPQEQITFRFCRECSNMLYPKEDRMTNKLMFACRTCQFSEEAQSSCVFRNNMYNTVGETAGVTQDVGSDPTVRAGVSFSCGDDEGGGGGGGKGKGEEGGEEEDFTCTYCGRELEEEFVQLEVEEAGGEAVRVREPEIGVEGSAFDLGEMSYMEEEEMGEDWEPDNGKMDGDVGGEEVLDAGKEGSQLQSGGSVRKSL